MEGVPQAYAPMPGARQIRSMPDQASGISTIYGSIASYFGVLRSGSTISRRAGGGLPRMIHRSVFENSAGMTPFPPEPGRDIPKAGDTPWDRHPRGIHRKDRPRPEDYRDAANDRGTEGGQLWRSRRRHLFSRVPFTMIGSRIESPGSAAAEE